MENCKDDMVTELRLGSRDRQPCSFGSVATPLAAWPLPALFPHHEQHLISLYQVTNDLADNSILLGTTDPPPLQVLKSLWEQVSQEQQILS